MRSVLVVLLIAGCRPPPPPAADAVPRLAAEESCAQATPLPPLPAAPPRDPYRLSHPEAMFVGQTPVTFLCDLPEHVLGIAATQTVDSGKRVVGGALQVIDRRGGTAQVAIAASSPGCLADQRTCALVASDPTIGRIEMLREQWLHTSGWVHGVDDLCRSLPDDTIATCSTATRMAYVELGCSGALALGLHDTSLPRAFDLDLESPVARLQGRAEATNGGDRWTFTFAGASAQDAAISAQPRAVKAPASAQLAIDLAQRRATLTVDGASEPCVAFALSRR